MLSVQTQQASLRKTCPPSPLQPVSISSCLLFKCSPSVDIQFLLTLSPLPDSFEPFFIHSTEVPELLDHTLERLEVTDSERVIQGHHGITVCAGMVEMLVLDKQKWKKQRWWLHRRIDNKHMTELVTTVN